MLRALPLLTETLRVRLNQIIVEVGQTTKLLLLTDGPASYLVACALLGDQKNAPRVVILGSRLGDLNGTQTVLFIDLFSRINTVRKALQELQHRGITPSRVIACVDIRGPRLGYLAEKDLSFLRFQPLLAFEFNPQEVESPPEPDKIIEWDAITHTPTRTRSEFVGLGTNLEREQFIEQHPELFRFGLHVVGERVHTVSFDTKGLASAHPDALVAWLATEVELLVNDLPSTTFNDVVLFTRSRSGVAGLTSDIGLALRQRLRNVKEFWVSDVPATPTSPKSLFPREEENILRNLRPLWRTDLFLERKPNKEYLAVYFDDAAVTGDTLFDTVSKIANLALERRPVALVTILIVNRLSPRETRFLSTCASLSRASTSVSTPGKTIEPVLFRFAALFRLQVRSVETEGQTAAVDLLDRISVGHGLRDTNLQAYLQVLRTKLSEGLQRGKPVAHLFWPETPVEPCPITTRAIRLRHLLALNQQHEGAIPDILRELQHVVNSHDYSVLSILALEPQLLKDDPLDREHVGTIRELCVEAICSDVAIALKSDALTVLFQYSGQVVECLDRILVPLLQDDNLYVQFLAQFLALCPRTSESDARVQASLDKVSLSGLRDRASAVADLFAARALVEQRFAIKSDADARAWIHHLMAEASGHPGLYAWTKFDVWVKGVNDTGRADIPEQHKQEANGCLDFAENTLLPGISALRWIAQQRRDLDAADKLEQALFKGATLCLAIRKIVESGTLTHGLKEDWYQLKKCTIAGASPDAFLAEWTGVSTGDPPALEALMPRYYCAPFVLFAKLAVQILGYTPVDPIPEDFKEQVVIVPVSRNAMYEVFRQLLENVRDHATPKTAEFAFSLDASNDAQYLLIQIKDTQRLDDRDGQRRGMADIFVTGKRFGFTVDEVPPTFRGGPYCVRLSFSDVIVARPRRRG
jgi:hypothetical protein